MVKKNKVYDEELFQIQYEGQMRLVKAIIFQILDYISISKKWNGKNISIKTLLSKRDRLREMHIWLNSWKWDIWLRIYTERYGSEIKVIKKNFIRIRNKSIRIVNKRIKQHENKINNKSNIVKTTLGKEK